jgi:sphingomyelin phosphodiesterase acid-like 3
MWTLFRAILPSLMASTLAAVLAGNQETYQPESQSLTLGPHESTFLVMSDIHFDPFANPDIVPRLISVDVRQWKYIFDSAAGHNFPQYGQDTNYTLLKSVLRAAREYRPAYRYDYIVVTGDYLTHDFREKYKKNGGDDASYQAFVVSTMIFVTRMIQESFPSLPVFGALGNNDSVCGDYTQSPGDDLLVKMSHEWNVLSLTPDARRDFATGGFYALPHPTVPNHELIVLNTTFWSRLYEDSCSAASSSPGTAELHWLAWKLYQSQIQRKTVSLIMHIPPGIDAYASAKLGKCGQSVTLWNQHFALQFEQLLEQYKSLLRDVYTGHLHMDDLRVFEDTQGTAFIDAHVVPAVSPIYNNNPAFEIAVYDKKDGTLKNYAIVYLEHLQDSLQRRKAPVWAIEYSVNAAYHLDEYGPGSAKQMAEAVRIDHETRTMFERFYDVNRTGNSALIGDHWLSYACAQTEISPDRYAECACGMPTAPQ